jgi:hypothetical protein
MFYIRVHFGSSLLARDPKAYTLKLADLELALRTTLNAVMPLRKGFKGGVPCPEWLLDCQGAKVIIPFANRGKGQTNPIYTKPPGKLGGCKLVPDCDFGLKATHFGVAYLHLGSGWNFFLYAVVEYPNYADPVYINIWNGASPSQHGTMYCALRYDSNTAQRCLCGQQCDLWSAHGWVCPMLQW